MDRRHQPTLSHRHDATPGTLPTLEIAASPQASPPPAITTWKNPVSGDWATPALWNTGAAPTASDSATIGVAGTYVVTVDSSDTAASLLIKTAGATVAEVAGGALSVVGTLSITAGTLALSGSATVSAAALSIGTGGVLTSSGGAVAGPVTLAGQTTLSANTLQLDGGGTLGGTISGAGTLLLNSGTFAAKAATLATLGNLAVANSVALNFTGPSGTLTAATSLNNFATIAAAAGTNITLAGALTLGQGGNWGQFAGPGTFTTGATTAIADNGGGLSLYLGTGVTWANSGTVNDAGLVYLNTIGSDTATISNLAGGTFNLTTDDASVVPFNSGTDKFINAGTLAKTGGTGTSTIGAVLTNTGVLNVTSGLLDFTGGGTLGGTISGAGTVGLGGGTFTGTAATLSGSGNLYVHNNGVLNFTGGTGTLAAATSLDNFGVLSAAAGTNFTLSGALTIGQTGNWGEFSGPGTLTTAGTTAIVNNAGALSLFIGGGVTWANSGTVNDAGLVYFNTVGSDTASIVNLAGGHFNLTTDSANITPYNGGTDSISNAGTVGKTGGTGTSTIAAVLTNTGIINSTSGILDFTQGGTLGGTISGAGTLGLGGGIFTGIAATLNGTGNLLVHNSANLNFTGATGTLATTISLNNFGILSAAAGTNFTLSGAIIAAQNGNWGEFSGPGTLTTAGTTTITDNAGGLSLFIGGGVTWANSGTVNDAGLLYFNTVSADTATISNLAGGHFNLTTDHTAFSTYNGGTDSFTNAGTLSKTGGTLTTALFMPMTNSGLISAASGTLALQNTLANTGKLMATAGATLDLSAATLSNLAGTSLSGGAFEADAHSIIQLATNTTIVTDSAAITLSGLGATIEALDSGTNTQTFLESTLATIAGPGTLSLLAGRNFTSTVPTLTVGGLLNLGGVAFKAPKLAVTGGGNVTGSGSVTATITDAGTITATGGTLVLAGAVTGTGALRAASGATLDLTRGGALTEAISGVGTLQLSGATAYTLASATIATAALAVDAGATLSGKGTVAGTTADAGTITATGGTLTLAGAVSGAGNLGATAAATLDLSAGGTFAGTISGAGTLQLDGTSPLVMQAASLTIATTTVDAGATLELAGGGATGAIGGAGTLQLDGPATYTLAGGTIGAAHLTVSTGATLSGNGTLSGAVADSGALLASGGILTVNGAVTGTGALQAAAGATLDLTAGGTLAGNISGAGTFRLDGASPFILQTGFTLSAASVIIDAGALLDLNGGGSLGGSIAGAGALQLDGGTYTLGGTLGTASVLLDANATLTGPGTVSGALTNNGLVSTATGTLLISGAVSGTGAYSAATGATLDLAGGGALANVTGAGTLRLDGASAFTIANAGNIQTAAIAIGAGATASATGTLGGTLADAGTLTAATATLALTGALSGNGTLAAAAGATLDILGGGTFAGAFAGAGTVRIDSALTLNAGAKITATNLVQTASVVLGANTSVTNLAGNTYTLTEAAHKTISLTGTTADKLTNAGTIVANGAGTASIGVAVINSGAINVGSGAMIFAGAVTNNGIIDAAGGTATFKKIVNGTGTINIDHGGTVSLLKGAAIGEHVDFIAGAGGGLLDLTKATTFKGTIADFATGDRIDLINTAETSYNFGNGVLTVMNGTTKVAALHFAGTYTTADFTLMSDAHGGTMITHT